MAKVVWDVDGVCVNYKKYILKKAIPFFKNTYNKDVINLNTINLQEMFQCSEQEEINFWKHHLNLLTYSIFEKARPGLKEIMDKIHECGDENIICSARAKCGEDSILGKIMRIACNYWIRKNELPIDEIFYVPYQNAAKEKLDIYRRINPLVVIEDDPDNISIISREFPVIKYCDDYNANVVGDNIIPVNNYDSLFLAIEQIKNPCKYEGFKFLNFAERNQLNDMELMEYYAQYRLTMMDMPYDRIRREYQEYEYNKMYKRLCMLQNIVGANTKLINPEMLNVLQSLKDTGKIFIVASHTTLDDIQQVEKAIGEMSFFLVKHEISSYPIVGNLLKRIGCEYVIRDDIESRYYVRNQLEKLVLHGKNVIILPEGTRNKTTNPILPFEKGCLSISQKTGCPLIPIPMKRTSDGKIAYLKICSPRVIQVQDDILLKQKELEKEMTDEILNIKDIIQNENPCKTYTKLKK